MRFRLGLVTGFAAGYYFGAMAGRERYEEINRTLRKVKGSEAYETAAEKAKAVADLSAERARDAVESVESKVGDGRSEGGAATSPYLSP